MHKKILLHAGICMVLVHAIIPCALQGMQRPPLSAWLEEQRARHDTGLDLEQARSRLAALQDIPPAPPLDFTAIDQLVIRLKTRILELEATLIDEKKQRVQELEAVVAAFFQNPQYSHAFPAKISTDFQTSSLVHQQLYECDQRLLKLLRLKNDRQEIIDQQNSILRLFEERIDSLNNLILRIIEYLSRLKQEQPVQGTTMLYDLLETYLIQGENIRVQTSPSFMRSLERINEASGNIGVINLLRNMQKLARTRDHFPIKPASLNNIISLFNRWQKDNPTWDVE